MQINLQKSREVVSILREDLSLIDSYNSLVSRMGPEIKKLLWKGNDLPRIDTIVFPTDAFNMDDDEVTAVLDIVTHLEVIENLVEIESDVRKQGVLKIERADLDKEANSLVILYSLIKEGVKERGIIRAIKLFTISSRLHDISRRKKKMVLEYCEIQNRIQEHWNKIKDIIRSEFGEIPEFFELRERLEEL